MFGLGPLELILILVAILIIFGAGKLPQVLGSLGKGVKEFREASEGSPTDTTSTSTTTTTQPANTTAATSATQTPPAAQNTTPPPEAKS
jgi:sec-independent protein translocase protein TatA